MKEALKRINETLNQLEKQKNSAYFQPGTVKSRSYSFEIFLQPPFAPTEIPEADKTPQLPNLDPSNGCSDLETDTSLEIDTLPAQIDIVDDKTQLEQVVRQIQELYHEGPIIDGWLEYYPPAPEPSAGMLKEVVFERTVDSAADCGLGLERSGELSDDSYRLSGLDTSGQQWSYSCPLEQLLSVTVAIARYQKLQQLLEKKHELETCLQGEQGREGEREKGVN